VGVNGVSKVWDIDTGIRLTGDPETVIFEFWELLVPGKHGTQVVISDNLIVPVVAIDISFAVRVSYASR